MDKHLKILNQYWGYKSFRSIQEDIIDSVYKGKDTLALMPTGGGKSITFQVPALSMEGICIVITPLIALMKDQVDTLLKKDIKAMALHSGLTQEEIKSGLNKCLHDEIKFLYISPERIGTKLFIERLERMNVSMIAVDESHCISQWGYDFRPSYLKIAGIREITGKNTPFLAVTATATNKVIEDIQERLLFKEKNVFRMSFERKNISYYVKESKDKLKDTLKLLKRIPGDGIIYVRTRKKTYEIASYLRENGLSSDFYHAGLDMDIRNQKQTIWQNGNTKVMVCTNAFGMGIDKPDVRYVIHTDLPDSLEAYFQEAGRAGRDGDKSFAVCLYNDQDIKRLKNRIDERFPAKQTIKDIYNKIHNFFQIGVGEGNGIIMDFSLNDFCSAFKLNIRTAYNSLKILQNQGYLEITDEIQNPSRVKIPVSKEDVYKFRLSNKSYEILLIYLLRSYGGLFSDYIPINEDKISKDTGLKGDTIYEHFKFLNKSGIIKYIPRKKTPLIIFNSDRIAENSFILDKDIYEYRRTDYEEKINAVSDYLETDNKCRSQLLLKYFGEENNNRCGICDYCIKRNKIHVSELEFDKVVEQIKERLTAEKDIDILIEEINIPKIRALKVIRWLIDNNKIVQTNKGTIIWKK